MTNIGDLVKGDYHANADQAWSYGTCIRATTADHIIIVNRCEYSKTTTHHQTMDAAFWRSHRYPVVVLKACGIKRGAGPSDLFLSAEPELRAIREERQDEMTGA